MSLIVGSEGRSLGSLILDQNLDLKETKTIGLDNSGEGRRPDLHVGQPQTTTYETVRLCYELPLHHGSSIERKE